MGHSQIVKYDNLKTRQMTPLATDNVVYRYDGRAKQVFNPILGDQQHPLQASRVIFQVPLRTGSGVALMGGRR
jgi:hypothetical protein